MDMYKLNYTGGLKAYDMMNKLGTEGFTKESAEKDIKSFQTDPDYRSDSAKLQVVLNDLNKSMVNFGKTAFDVKVAGMSALEKPLNFIADILGKNIFNDMITNATGKLYDSRTEDVVFFGQMQKLLENGLTKPGTEDYETAKQVLTQISIMNPTDLQIAKDYNLFNREFKNLDDLLHALKNQKIAVPEGTVVVPNTVGGILKAGQRTPEFQQLYDEYGKLGGDYGGETKKDLKEVFDLIDTIPSAQHNGNFEELAKAVIKANDSKGIDDGEYDVISDLIKNLFNDFKSSIIEFKSATENVKTGADTLSKMSFEINTP